ncbi:TadE/TadG family type IV pilus assembly protein [Vibrio fluminensis]|uniref:TadE/TadG family type IV pilus assembly protein n=1 Tax=Vibrio fluminensis TaxID=2783614 RepID=UPI0018886779|nr:TadE/TadG family type IV pilus assembly protein [Vibrio fluminensis]
MKIHFSRQKGHAAIMFVMVVPVLLGVFNLGTEGARAMQQKARMNDALEVAALAISAHDDPNLQNEDDPENYGSSVNRQIAADFISVYFPNEEINGPGDLQQLTIKRSKCDDGPKCDSSEGTYYQYDLSAALEYETWFKGNGAVTGFDDTMVVGASSTALRLDAEPLDIMFVADFSGSMQKKPKSGGSKKYVELINIIKTIAKELDEHNDNLAHKNFTIGIVPYDSNTYRKSSSGLCSSTDPGESCTQRIEHSVFEKELDSDGQVIFNRRVDFDASRQQALMVDYDADPAGEFNIGNYHGSNFFNLELTAELGQDEHLISNLSNFLPASGTASFQGVIEGFKLAKKGENKRRVIIIISDGVDEDEKGPLPGEVNKNLTDTDGPKHHYQQIAEELMATRELCLKMKEEMKQIQVDGEEVELSFYLVAFDYKEGITNDGLDACSDTTYKADSTEELQEYLFSILNEEIGHLK